MTTPGNFARIFASGYEITPDAVQSTYQHTYADMAVMSENVGIRQHAPGIFTPNYALNGGYARHGAGAVTAHNLLNPSGIGNANDTEFIITELLGNNAAPAQGDCAVLFDGGLFDYKRQNPFNAPLTYAATFKPRGKRMPPFPVLQYINDTFKTSTNISSSPYDDGAEASAGTSQGGVMVAQVYNPTGVAATGNIGVPTQPVAADTVTVNGTVYTWRAALTPTAGEVLIGANALASAQNLYAALTGGVGAGTTYATGTASFNQTLLGATVFFSPPTGVNNTINITYAVTGTGGNAFTLAKSGTGGLTISAATLSGGVAGDTYNLTVASATTSGGAYTTFATQNGIGATRAAYRIEVAIGTLINEWIKATLTLASGAGTSQTMGICVVFGRYFQS